MTTLKTVLGWLLNTELRTVQLPESRVLRLNKILAKLLKGKKSKQKGLVPCTWGAMVNSPRNTGW